MEIGLGRPKEAKEHMVMSMAIPDEDWGSFGSAGNPTTVTTLVLVAQWVTMTQPHPSEAADGDSAAGSPFHLDAGSPLDWIGACREKRGKGFLGRQGLATHWGDSE